MQDILVNLGKELKRIRKSKNLNLKEVAEMSGVSTGLVSKIENFRTTPSLPVLLKIMRTLEINLSELNLNTNGTEKFIHVKKGEGQVEDRDDSVGLEYTFLFSSQISRDNLRTYIVTVFAGVYREPIATDATEIIYVISGEVNYIVQDETVLLRKGDVLFFDGSIPHALHNKTPEKVVLLKMYMI